VGWSYQAIFLQNGSIRTFPSAHWSWDLCYHVFFPRHGFVEILWFNWECFIVFVFWLYLIFHQYSSTRILNPEKHVEKRGMVKMTCKGTVWQGIEKGKCHCHFEWCVCIWFVNFEFCQRVITGQQAFNLSCHMKGQICHCQSQSQVLVLPFYYLLINWLINETVRFSCDFSKTAMDDIYIYIYIHNFLKQKGFWWRGHWNKLSSWVVILLSSFNFFHEMGPYAWGYKSYCF